MRDRKLTTIVVMRKGRKIEIPVETKLKAAIAARLQGKYAFKVEPVKK